MQRLRYLLRLRNHYSFVTQRALPLLAMFSITLLITALLICLPTLTSQAQTPTSSPQQRFSSEELAILIIVLVVVVVALPIGYLVLNKPRQSLRSLLLVSTDTEAQKLITNVARRVGYQAITVYRYEDALDRLRQNATLSMIVIDDSVPQYEAGLLISMLRGSPIGLRPLILIHDSSELGQTAPSYRAEVVVSRPLTERALEAAIRQVSDQLW